MNKELYLIRDPEDNEIKQFQDKDQSVTSILEYKKLIIPIYYNDETQQFYMIYNRTRYYSGYYNLHFISDFINIIDEN